MTHHKKHKPPFFKLRSIYLWHRYMGLTVALFAIMLSLTGIALTHTTSFKLDSKPVKTGWLLDWYDIETPQRLISYTAGKQSVSLVEDKLYINKVVINGHYGNLAGAVELEGIIVVAIDTYILLLTYEGEVIERLTDINNQVEKILAIGLFPDNRLGIRTSKGLQATNINFSYWEEDSADSPVWSTPTELPAELQDTIKQDYRSNILNLERVMLDIHSGRILGESGVIIVDIAAILFMLLAGSGFWIWLQQQNKRASHRKNRLTSIKKKPGAGPG